VRTARSSVGEKQLPIIPGMVAEVHILTGKRTVMQYLLKPILRAKENAFTER
jgi:adhesin transport system membrane fusion protein